MKISTTVWVTVKTMVACLRIRQCEKVYLETDNTGMSKDTYPCSWCVRELVPTYHAIVEGFVVGTRDFLTQKQCFS